MSAVGVCLTMLDLAGGQSLPPALNPLPVAANAGTGNEDPCKPLNLQLASELSFRQRACFYGARLTSRSMLLRASFMSGYAQLRNNPHVEGRGFEEFGRRMGVFYARRTAQSTGDLKAGNSYAEIPRYRPSGQERLCKRL